MPKTDAPKGGLDLAGKAVVVTGAGSGLGEAVAKGAAAIGARVVVNDVDPQLAETCAAAIRAAGGEAIAHPADIAVWSQAEGLIERCLADYGRIDGLVNNAGVHLPARSWDMQEASVRKTLEVNVLGTLACAGRALKAMRAQGSGSVVNTTSGAQMGLNWRPDYGASKGAVASFTYVAALELEGSGVRVNAIAPNVSTRMLDETAAFMRAQNTPWVRPDMRSPESNAAMHLYLLSDRSKALNGQILGIRADGELYIASHPAILGPTVTRPEWTPLAVAEAIEAGRLAPAQPLGAVRADLGKSGG